ncbi:MAG: heme d1 biosynthesis radical SAM protein NirJ [Gammaproteobacteria bacterium]|jgi:heme d1 biosynthesis radical SAM protein NirJ|nr:heme d1 biosynthesis radical SAM protein NirJ [Gammaproteobacteria bacterium]MBT4330305.1 heme d1 biosynthesis radical SAM protein NirJ [Gammaproteobacteria bacterium]MBT5633985.1 heme d1 biosynthesis radical SAM protein NirJ [Gammaproteobacteria bacterium]MBT6081166.1 heme d1 biosynthesis radical SAM protein NirJ [Gammaproteobacteria bacterium]MBT6668823.1 heme d1 biosynthesis radical SAM protein NirJ [Gammaproteobacteria bacterium]
MFRISQYMRAIRNPAPIRPARSPSGPVVIWNLIRRCNLTCKHCYSISADTHFKGELSTEEAYTVLDDLKQYGVPVLILSGGEPLLRPDIFEISHRAKAMGFYVGLSTNGTLITEENIQQIADVGYDYVGISIDGLEQTHDEFRRLEGAFQQSMQGIDLCQQHGIKVGLRFTLTQENAKDLEPLLELTEARGIDKFYLSHLNYAGRGNKNREGDAHHQTTRKAMDLLFKRAWEQSEQQGGIEFVTGNNDADGLYLLHWVEQQFPDRADEIRQRLEQWGGNQTGIHISNIDNLGKVHPDTMWWDTTLGSVRERPFSEIWEDISNPLMAGLKQKPRPVTGRCGECSGFNICGGNTRVRALQLYDDLWAEDPGCYLTNKEIGL